MDSNLEELIKSWDKPPRPPEQSLPRWVIKYRQWQSDRDTFRERFKTYTDFLEGEESVNNKESQPSHTLIDLACLALRGKLMMVKGMSKVCHQG